jgi:hypothetical protein
VIKEKKTYSKKTYPENQHTMLPSCTQLLFVSQEPILCQQLYHPLHLGSSLCSLSMPGLHISRCKYKLLLNNPKISQQDIKPNLYCISCPTRILLRCSTVQEPGENAEKTKPFRVEGLNSLFALPFERVQTSLSGV